MDGAKAVALPTKLGQSIEVRETSGLDIHWKSYDPQAEVWFEASFDLFNLDVKKTTDQEKAEYLSSLLYRCIELNSDFLSKWKKYRVSAYLGFDPEWGLGSSSSLINCVAQWADVDPIEVLRSTIGGSGYDVAVAGSNHPITYQLKNEHSLVTECAFDPKFKDQLYFIYSGHKQSTAEGIEYYKSKPSPAKEQLKQFDGFADKMTTTKRLEEFESIIEEHDGLMSEILEKPRLQSDEKFKDYWGKLKPLGAWGGDFFLATSCENKAKTEEYFQKKGFSQIFPYEELILSQVPENA